MNLADLQLPDTVDGLKAMVLAMADALEADIAVLKATNAAANDRIARLTSIIAMFERAQHGKRSERLRIDPLNDEQYGFVFDEIETGLAEIQAGLEKARGSSNTKRLARLRKGFAPHLERIEVVIEPEDVRPCPVPERVRGEGLLRSSPQPMAARHEREPQRPFAAILPEGH